MHNVYAEEEEEGASISSAQLTLENSITMNKMKLLKAKMENMNLNKKVVPDERLCIDKIVQKCLKTRLVVLSQTVIILSF